MNNMAVSALLRRHRESRSMLVRQATQPGFDLQDNSTINLNIGGTSYRLSSKSIRKRGQIGLLYKFLMLTHAERRNICDDFLPRTQEYYFERIPSIFEPIYAYYLTGVCERPLWYVETIWKQELEFWGLRRIFDPMNKKRSMTAAMVYRAPKDPFDAVRYGRWRKRLWNLLENPSSSQGAKIVAVISILAVIVSNLCTVLSTLPELRINATDADDVITDEAHPAFAYVEVVCIIYFSLEYFTKLMVTINRREFFFKFINIIDLIAILPFYIELSLLIFGIDSNELQDFKGAILVLRILRVLRVIRLLKLGRYSTGLQMFVAVLHRSLAQLGMVMAVVGIGVVFFSTLVYFAEKEDPDTLFRSIPHAFWWCIVTITTVGYGDMVPMTVVGKLVASCAIASGLLVISLPITIIVDNFVSVQQEFDRKREENILITALDANNASDDSDPENMV